MQLRLSQLLWLQLRHAARILTFVGMHHRATGKTSLASYLRGLFPRTSKIRLRTRTRICGDRVRCVNEITDLSRRCEIERALPDTELDGFVDALARRIASFDRRPIAAAKKLVNQVSLPSADHLLDGLNSFLTALTWPEALQRIQTLLKQGLQQDPDFEKRWPEVLGSFLEDQPKRP